MNMSTEDLKLDGGYIFNTYGKKTADIFGSGCMSTKIAEMEVYLIR